MQGSLFETAEQQAESHAAEFFRTPARIVYQLLDTAGRWHGLPDGLWIDAGSGDGAIWSACRAGRPDSRFIAVDIRPHAIEQSRQLHTERKLVHGITADWLDLSGMSQLVVSGAEVVLMNPPFSWAHHFARKAWEYCPDAWVWMLNRQSFGKPAGERGPWLMRHWPEYKLQCVGARPTFTGDGHTDRAEYIWYGWSPTGRNRDHCRWEGPCVQR